MNILFFDTETNGLPQWKTPSDHSSQPHIVQIAALLVNADDWTIKDMMNVVVKPQGWSWDENCEAFKTHGIPMDYALKKGVREFDALSCFLELWNEAEVRVAHNSTFDNRIIRIALKRYIPELVEKWQTTKFECTGRMSKPFNPAWASSMKGFKIPSLKDCYKFFFGKDLENHHDALSDTKHCLDIYKECVKRGDPTQGPAQSLGLDTKFKFGKKRGEVLEDVIDEDPDYIRWLMDLLDRKGIS